MRPTAADGLDVRPLGWLSLQPAGPAIQPFSTSPRYQVEPVPRTLVGQNLWMPPVQETGESDAISSGEWLELVRDSGFDDVGLWDVVAEGTESDWLILLHALDRAAEDPADLVTSIAISQDRDPVEGIPGETVGIRLCDGVTAHARMFSDDEIEIDFDHRELAPGNAHAVLFVMGLLGDSTGGPTRLTSEGDHRIVAMTYEPSSKQYQLHL